MNKKKIVIMMLVLVMVLSLAVTALAGCNDKEDIDGYQQVDGISLADALGYALWNTVAKDSLNTLSASAKLTVTVNQQVYVIELNTGLALSEDGGKNFFALSCYDGNAGANILNIYYNEAFSDIYGAGWAAYNERVFVDIGDGANAQHYAVNALSVSNTLADQTRKDEDGNVIVDEDGVPVKGLYMTDDEADDYANDAASSIEEIFEYFDMIKGMADKMKKGKPVSSSLYQSEDFQNLLLRVKLDRVLENAASILGIVDTYGEKLGLALTADGLSDILPNLTIDLIFKFNDVAGSNFEDATIAGIEAKISVPQKDIVVNRADNSKFVEINVSKDLTLGVAVDFGFGEDYEDYGILPLAPASAKIINAVNFEASGQLELKKGLEFNFELLDDDMTIGIPEGTYSIELGVDVNPFKLVSAKFDFKNDLRGSLTSILEAVDYLGVKIENTTNTSAPKLELYLYRTAGVLKGNFVSIGLLGDLAGQFSDLLGDGISLDTILDKVLKIIPSSKEEDTENTETVALSDVSSSDAEEDEVDLTPIKELFEHLTAFINVGGNFMDVEVTEHVVNTNEYGIVNADGKPVDASGNVIPEGNTTTKQDVKNLGDTTITVKGVVNGDGLKLDATLKNLVTYVDKTTKDTAGDGAVDLTISLEATKGGLKLTAKTTKNGEASPLVISINGNKMELPLDLVLELSNVSFGTAKYVAPTTNN